MLKLVLRPVGRADPRQPTTALGYEQKSHKERVFFGATVTYLTQAGDENTVRIVGVDEVRHERGEISWVSPVARALLKAEEGDVVTVRTPHGSETIEVLEISYADA